jgi:group I intron endonuclease
MENIVHDVFEELPHRKGNVPGVYIIEHEETSKIYIGSSGSLSERKRTHESDLRLGKNSNKPLQELFNASPNLTFTFVKTESRDAAYEYEQKLLDHYKDSDLLLNKELCARSSVGIKRSEETKRKVGEAGKGRVSGNKGKTLSEQDYQKFLESRVKLHKPVEIEGVRFNSLTSAAKDLNLNIACVSKRINSTTNKFQNWNYI